jgi:Dehydrogenases with different specificities (related to short-chain alcohol dehydrogenases)
MKIKDCKAVVTGGASGLGEATVRNIVGCGGRACIFDIQDEKGEALAKELGDNAMYAHTDIVDDASTQAGIKKAVDAFGGINVAVNCAGVGVANKVVGKKGVVALEKLKKVIDINLIGTMNVIRLAVEQMMKNDPMEDDEKGVIVNTSSVAATEGQIGQMAYSASKGGVVSLTVPVARECAEYGIRVNAIAPGIFNTPMLAMAPENVKLALGQMIPFPKRLGHPSEYARLVQHIIENTMINGGVIRLDGGIRMAAR